MLHDSYFTLSFIARKARALRNGEYPIFVRITVSGQVAEMNIGRGVIPDNWDQKRAISKGRSRRDLELNYVILIWIKWWFRIADLQANAVLSYGFTTWSKSSHVYMASVSVAQSTFRVPGNITCNGHVNNLPK